MIALAVQQTKLNPSDGNRLGVHRLWVRGRCPQTL